MVEEATIRAVLDHVDKQFVASESDERTVTGGRLGGSLMDKQQTFGERAVGLTFNPSGDPDVAVLKEMIAAFIDRCNMHRDQATDPEVKRMYSVAITEAQTAQMWAVKAATWRT
jgi:hypothetical protein